MSDYVARKVMQGYPSNVIDHIMALPKGSRPRVGSRLVYYSPYRPVRGALLREPGVEIVDVDGGMRGMVLSDQPLSPEAIEGDDLVPVGRAAAWAIASVAPMPVELAHVDEQGVARAALVHEGTSGLPRLTWFEEGIGPTGHLEGRDPVELIHEALSAGYRRLAPGLVDAIMGTT